MKPKKPKRQPNESRTPRTVVNDQAREVAVASTRVRCGGGFRIVRRQVGVC